MKKRKVQKTNPHTDKLIALDKQKKLSNDYVLIEKSALKKSKIKKHKLPKQRSKNEQLPYAKFLKTGYWKKVRSDIMKRDNYTCQKCGNKKDLIIHHKTYKHHFKEHKYPEDLITLCSNCHDKEHNLVK